MKIDIDRDFETSPITIDEAIELFKSESSDLALASFRTIELACDKMEVENFRYASDIIARWEDYNEEIRYMMMEFTA